MHPKNAPARLAPLAAFLFAWLVWPPGDAAGTPAEAPSRQGPTAGQLVIEGKFIESLTLVDRAGRQTQFARPSEKPSLPPGEYRVSRVELQGGFNSNCPSARQQDWFWVTAGEPYALRVGAPLVPSLKVHRQGTELQLDYELLDAGGRPYVPRASSNPPWFTIFYDGRQIAAGSFRYG